MSPNPIAQEPYPSTTKAAPIPLQVNTNLTFGASNDDKYSPATASTPSIRDNTECQPVYIQRLEPCRSRSAPVIYDATSSQDGPNAHHQPSNDSSPVRSAILDGATQMVSGRAAAVLAAAAVVVPPCTSAVLMWLGSGFAHGASIFRSAPVGDWTVVALTMGLILGLLCGAAAFFVARRAVGEHAREMLDGGGGGVWARVRGAWRGLRTDERVRCVGWACAAAGVFALPVGAGIYRWPDGYHAFDGLVVTAIGIGVLAMVAVVGQFGASLWRTISRRLKAGRAPGGESLGRKAKV